MSLSEERYEPRTARAKRKARLARLGFNVPRERYNPPVALSPIVPMAWDAGIETMWFHDLVSPPRPPKPEQPTIASIQHAVANYFGISKSELISPIRTAHVTRARQIAMCLSRALTYRSYAEIGRRFGNRDHTTVMHGEQKIYRLLADDDSVRVDVNLIKASLR
jgi:hypothetical protein